MKKKLMIALPVLLVLVGGVYKFKLAPKPKPVVHKVEGTLVPLDPEFVVNLAGGHYGKLSVALLVSKAPPASAESGAAELEEGAAVRAVITDELTGANADQLIDRSKRSALVREVLTALKHRTDESVTQVLFTDIAVQ